MMTLLFWPILLSFAVAVIIAFLLTIADGRFRIMDHPNERSLHVTPTPRSGGLAIWAGMTLGVVVLLAARTLRPELMWISAAALLTGVISFLDDRSQVPVRIRLMVHLVAAGLLSASGMAVPSLWPGSNIDLPLSVVGLLGVLFVVWMTNLYNFMDGMDGFAGGMATLGFGTLGLLSYLAGDDYYAAICWVIAAAATGFLVWNFPPARIFMGDTGSSTLGLLAAALSLWADRAGLFPLWIAILIFSPFIIDATVTLLRRTIKGERVWEAHRSHYYQRLVQAGWGHRRTVLWEYGLMLLCSLSAYAAYRASVIVQWVILGGVASVYLLAVIGVHGIEKRHTTSQASKISS
jgi:UDP-N-acetylmuramyl pentapeptide phosphotransferase/UDP-N-acetylglucosamine-1-phosphate transferase